MVTIENQEKDQLELDVQDYMELNYCSEQEALKAVKKEWKIDASPINDFLMPLKTDRE